MYCYNCGVPLSEYDYCTACGADVGVYKKLIFASNRLYNEGLEKANVRDLTGAIGTLRQCLRINKNHIEARNLLGLVYFEMGEIAAALSEWVISQNIRPEKNLATEYVSFVQNNTSELKKLNQCIEKYNKAYQLCTTDSIDLAGVQLRQAISLSPGFVRAQLLLTLIYIHEEKWENAEREARRVLEIDKGNTRAKVYMQEAARMLDADEDDKHVGFGKKDDIVRYQSGNELIIQPVNAKEPKSQGASTLLNIFIGLVLGAAAMYFLVLPARVSSVDSGNQDVQKQLSEQIDNKTATIQELEAKVTILERDKEDLENTIAGYTGADGTLDIIDHLLDAASEYITTGDAMVTAAYVDEASKSVDFDAMSESYRDLYNALVGQIGETASSTYYNEGYTAYRNENYETAVDLLSRALNYTPDNEDALFALGDSYRRMGNQEEELEVFGRIIKDFPDSEYARRAKVYLDELQTDN